MPLPGDLNTIILTGSFLDATGSTLAGTVTLTPSVAVTDSTGKVVIPMQPVSVSLRGGAFALSGIVCTDNVNLAPTGWTYTITVQLDSQTITGSYLLPHTLGSSVDFSSLIQVFPGPPVSTLYGVLASGNTNTWQSNQVFDGNVQIPASASNGYVLTSDAQGNATWKPAGSSSGVQVGGDIGGTNLNPQVISTHLAAPLPIAQGGSGQSAQQAAINALTGTQSAGTYLRSDGTNASLAAIQAGDVPTLNQSTTGTAANVTGVVAIANGGTGQATAPNAFNALSPLTTLGDMLYASGTNTNARVAGNTGTTKQFLGQTGTGSASAAPTWGTLATPDIPGYFHDTPAQRGWAEWNFPIMDAGANGTQAFASGTVYGASFIAQSNKTISKVGYNASALAVTPAAGENLIALYSVSGSTATQLTITGDLSTWGSTNNAVFASLGSSETMVPGSTYIVLFISVAATPVILRGVSGASMSWLNAGLSNTAAPWFKFFVYATGQTALPASFAMSAGTMNASGALAPWFALQ